MPHDRFNRNTLAEAGAATVSRETLARIGAQGGAFKMPDGALKCEHGTDITRYACGTCCAEPPPMPLLEAQELIYGDRAAAYGPPSENFTRIAKLWSATLEHPITATQVALCLTQLKIARLMHQPDHHDSITDAAGYIGCYDRIVNRR